MSGLTQFIRNNSKVIEDIFGSLDNIVVRNNYKEYMRTLDTYDQQYRSFLAYNETKNKMDTMPITNEDAKNLYKQASDFIPDWEKNEELTKSEPYLKYQQSLQSGPGTTQESYLNYLTKNNPDEALRLKQSGLIQSKTIDPTADEIKQYKLGKLAPEEQALYKKYEANPIKPGEYNRNLSEMIFKSYPRLVSEGSLGSSLADIFSQQGSQLQIPQQKTTFEDKEIGGEIVRVYNDGRVVPLYNSLKNREQKQTTKDWEIFQKEDGTPYWGERVNKDGKWSIEYRNDLNPEEKFNYDIEHEQKTKTGPYTPYHPGSRRSPKIQKEQSDTQNQAEKLLKDFNASKLKVSSRNWVDMNSKSQKYLEDNKDAINDQKDYLDQRNQLKTLGYEDPDAVVQYYGKQTGSDVNKMQDIDEFNNAYKTVLYDGGDNSLDNTLHSLYNVETDPQRGGSTDNLKNAIDDIYNWLGTQYNNLSKDVADAVYRYVEDYVAKVYKSKGL